MGEMIGSVRIFEPGYGVAARIMFHDPLQGEHL